MLFRSPGPSPAATEFDPHEAISALESRGATAVAMTPDQVAALLHALARRGSPLASTTLRLAISVGAALPPAWPAQWLAATGTELRQG